MIHVFLDSHVILRGFQIFSIAPKGAKLHMSRVLEQPRARIPLPKTYSREQRSKTLHIIRVFHVPNRKNPHFARGISKKLGRRRLVSFLRTARPPGSVQPPRERRALPDRFAFCQIVQILGYPFALFRRRRIGPDLDSFSSQGRGERKCLAATVAAGANVLR